jgi:hypothetical protein
VVRKLSFAILLLIVAGCGSDGNVSAVTPVMADTRGTYRLAAASTSVTAPDGTVTTTASPAVGVLRLSDTGYSLTVFAPAAQVSTGSYVLGASVNTILNSRDGAFSLASLTPPGVLTGSYLVTPDFTLTLNYNQSALPDLSLVSRSETWVKQSDSPNQ